MPESGDPLKPWRIESVSAERMKTLAAVLRDPNPIHLDPAAVATLGLGHRVINQGPANLAYVINMLSAALPGARLLELDARFLANVFGGDRVEAGGRVIAVEAEATGTRVTCEVWLNVSEQGPAVAGNAVLQLPKAQQ
jgi:acyl dehydratase